MENCILLRPLSLTIGLKVQSLLSLRLFHVTHDIKKRIAQIAHLKHSGV